MFRAIGYIIASWHEKRAYEAYLRSRMPRVVWGEPHIPRVPRKAR